MDSMDQQARHADTHSPGARRPDDAERLMQAAVQGSPSPAPTETRTPATPSRSEAQMPDTMQAELDKAMRSGAFAEAGAEAKAAAGGVGATAPGAKPAIRGPRVIEGGREHRKGRVVSVGPTDIFVEFGPKELGVVARTQYPDEADLPVVGGELEVVIDRFNAEEQLFLCSRPGAVQKAEWELLQPGQVVEARVTGMNKGGLELEVAHHQAFMPASQVDLHRIDDLSVFVGEKLTCVVQRIDRSGKGNIVLSRRDILAEERERERGKIRETLKEGDVMQGVVKKLMPFGAFVDIGGVDGLVHISDMSHDRVNRPEQVVKPGDSVTVKVLKVDWEKDRISLGMKQTQSDPFSTAASEVKEGEIVSGRVTKLLDFGALIEVAPGVEGLAHISELSWKRINQVGDAVKVDQVVQVMVLGVDKAKRRVSLSIKQTTERPVTERDKKMASTVEEIKKETPALRRMREEAKKKHGAKPLKSGLGQIGGMGLGDLKL
ncbi:MAG: S1 RNA-binding domain-containing protein [Phycisphaeraceae bacterium]|nr:S1 RNA-binding domain-containing protein [Phycisphaeraceae bacterium]